MNQNAIDFLKSLQDNERSLHNLTPDSFSLENIRRLLFLLGEPHKKLRVIHIAGSKGKGSTALLVAHVLISAGYRVGVYTSPHFFDLRERVRILEQRMRFAEKEDLLPGQIFSAQLQSVCCLIRSVVEKNPDLVLTFFEVMTAVAFMYFEQEQVDFVILETGLGGRLDATNVCASMISVITSIGLEHTKILGSTVEAIAAEKAAIIKPVNTIAVVAPQTSEVRAVILHQAKQANVNILWTEDECGWELEQRLIDRQVLAFHRNNKWVEHVPLALLGAHQALNAMVAFAVLDVLDQMGFNISDEHIRDGFDSVVWPGRFEILGEDPQFILDCAHTNESIGALVKTVQEFLRQPIEAVIVGVSEDKDRSGMLDQLAALTENLILTRAEHARAHQFSDNEIRGLEKKFHVTVIRSVIESVRYAQQTFPGKTILICGSTFVVAQARRLLM